MDQNLKKFITDLEFQYENIEKDIDIELVLREVGLRFTELRLISGLSRTEFAKKVGIRPEHLSRLVTGNHNPSILYLEKIAQKVGAHVEISFVMDDGETCHEKDRRLTGTKWLPIKHIRPYLEMIGGRFR